MLDRSILIVAMVAMLVVSGTAIHAEEKDARSAAAIQDNSFLIEEAYN